MRLNLGAGHFREDGYVSVDIVPNPNLDVVADLREPWPFDDNSIDGARASHVLEHFAAMDRVHFVNELYRVLKPNAEALIVTPHWCSQRAYGDMTHLWPPVSEAWYYYLSAAWRRVHADADSGGMYSCDFRAKWQYSVNDTHFANADRKTVHALNFYRDVAQDLCATITALK